MPAMHQNPFPLAIPRCLWYDINKLYEIMTKDGSNGAKGAVRMANIKLFVCCHRPEEVPAHPLLRPVQVGAALADVRFPGFLYDDGGENISDKNRSYCELTAQYWAWKNVQADYYGFFHYRRYLYSSQTARRPYRIEAKPTLELLDRLGYARFEELICQHDLILPRGEDMRLPVREHYAGARFHHRVDLERAERIVGELTPEYAPAMERYLSGSMCYFGNIFIMKRQVFDHYCQWLFPILEEFDRRTDTSGYCAQERRVDGYLAERLLGTYATHHQELDHLELPRVHFIEDPAERLKKQAVNALLPPGSVRRSWIKSLKR